MIGMRIVKGVAVGAAVSALVLGSAYGVLAATTQDSEQYPTIVEKLAKAFNLDPAKVDNVFQEERKARIANRDAAAEKRLDQLVTDKKITAAQKDAILKKMDEFQTKMESLRNVAPEKRMTEMQSLRTELQTWMKDNGLDTIQGIPGIGGLGRGMRGGMSGGCDQSGNCNSGACGQMGGRGFMGGAGSGFGSQGNPGVSKSSANTAQSNSSL